MIGDEVGITEDLYNIMIGRHAVAVEVLSKRIAIKDQRIAELEAFQAEITANALANTPKEDSRG